jgi:activator of 2-hydroxyglutaryl-CoA dehydratase
MLKTKLTTTLVLVLPSDQGGYIVYIDASSFGLRCVLMEHYKTIAYETQSSQE